MTLFIPSLEKCNIYSTYDESKREIVSKIQILFHGCIVYHKLDVNIDFVEDARFLNWFDYIIVHRSKGICCITNSNIEQTLTYRLLVISEEILPGRIEFIKNESIMDALIDAQNILNNWNSSRTYELESCLVIQFLKEAMQIESLPPTNFNGKMLINDQRFIRLSNTKGLIKHITPELDQKEINRLHQYLRQKVSTNQLTA